MAEANVEWRPLCVEGLFGERDPRSDAEPYAHSSVRKYGERMLTWPAAREWEKEAARRWLDAQASSWTSGPCG